MNDHAWIDFKNPLAERLRHGQLGLALQVKQVHALSVAMLAQVSGYDAIYIDLQHTAISIATAADLSLAALAAGVCPLVRISGNQYDDALRLLDAGALGIIVPEVTSARQVRDAVEHLRFAPLGKRSTAGVWPHFAYRPVPASEAARVLNAQTTIVVMVESQEALDHLDEIAAVDGIDVIHMGANDLAADLGIPGQLEHPRLQEAFALVLEACRRHGKAAGIGGYAGKPALLETYVKMGAQFLTAANDWNLLMAAATERARLLRQLPRA